MNNATPALYYKNIVSSKEYSRFNMIEETLYLKIGRWIIQYHLPGFYLLKREFPRGLMQLYSC